MHILQSLFYLAIALHVSGIIVTHLEEYSVVSGCVLTVHIQTPN